MKRITLAVALRFALAALCACTRDAPTAEHAAEAKEPALALERGAHGEVAVHATKEALEGLGLETAELAAVDVLAETEAYGRVVLDPAATFTLRAPSAGILRAASWPKLGETLAPRADFARVEPRFSAAERADFAARRADADGERTQARAELANAELALARARQLNADDKSVSDKALQEADGRVASLNARIASAESRAAAIDAALRGEASALALDRGGEVVEVLAHPGESVEAGAALVALADFTAPLAEITLPIGAPLEWTSARIASLRRPEHLVAAAVESRAVEPETSSRGAVLRLRVAPADAARARELRPGEPVVARLALGSSAARGASIPRDAVLRVGGATWVWIETAEGVFTRKAVTLDSPLEPNWASRDAALVGAKVVVRGAQALLSFELTAAQSGSGASEE